MGAILAVIGHRPQQELAGKLTSMLQRSPYRGEPQPWAEPGLAIAVQSLGWDASLARHEQWIVATQGYISNWDDLARDRDWPLTGLTTDAQRLAAGFSRFGEAVFPWLRGEFALLIYDRQQQTVLAVRDAIGARPLFFQVEDGLLFMASEIRQVLAGSGTAPTPNKAMLGSYLLRCPIQQDLTLDQSVRRVVPACAWRYSCKQPDTAPRLQAYWTPPPVSPSRRYQSETLTQTFRALLEQAVTRATPAHPFAVCLSGGLDSGAVWGLVAHRAAQGDAHAAQGVPCSLVFPGMDCDESPRIAAMRAFTRAARYLETDAARVDPVAALAAAIERTDGFVHGTGYFMALLAGSTAADGRGTLLTGYGEEWVGGSFRYLADDLRVGRWWSVFRTLRQATPYRVKGTPRWPGLLNDCGLGRLNRLRRWRKPAPTSPQPVRYSIQPQAIPPLLTHLRPEPRASGDRRRLFQLLHQAQSTLLYEAVEQLAAADGVELRHPFNDLDLVEFAFRTPPRAFTGGIRHKHLLRVALHDQLAPSVRDLLDKTLFNEVVAPYTRALAVKSATAFESLVLLGLLNGAESDRFWSGLHDPTRLALTHAYIIEQLAKRYKVKFSATS